jgi:hypothetical protein
LPYSLIFPGPSESIRDTVVSTLQGSISVLDGVMSTISPAITLGVDLDSTFVNLGDPEVLPDAAEFPFWFCVVGGGKSDAKDEEVVRRQQNGYWSTFYTNIYFYLHPSTFPTTSKTPAQAFVQAAQRERLRLRVTDWLVRGVFNNATNYSITLGSRQFATAPAYDHLDECFVSDITMGFIPKSFGGTQWVFMAHYIFRGKIYGGY